MGRRAGRRGRRRARERIAGAQDREPSPCRQARVAVSAGTASRRGSRAGPAAKPAGAGAGLRKPAPVVAPEPVGAVCGRASAPPPAFSSSGLAARTARRRDSSPSPRTKVTIGRGRAPTSRLAGRRVYMADRPRCGHRRARRPVRRSEDAGSPSGVWVRAQGVQGGRSREERRRCGSARADPGGGERPAGAGRSRTTTARARSSPQHAVGRQRASSSAAAPEASLDPEGHEARRAATRSSASTPRAPRSTWPRQHQLGTLRPHRERPLPLASRRRVPRLAAPALPLRELQPPIEKLKKTDVVVEAPPEALAPAAARRHRRPRRTAASGAAAAPVCRQFRPERHGGDDRASCSPRCRSPPAPGQDVLHSLLRLPEVALSPGHEDVARPARPAEHQEEPLCWEMQGRECAGFVRRPGPRRRRTTLVRARRRGSPELNTLEFKAGGRARSRKTAPPRLRRQGQRTA